MFNVKLKQTLTGHASDVTSVDYKNGILASASGDKTIRIYKQDCQGHFIETGYSPFRNHSYGVNCVCFSPSGQFLASCSIDGQIILWNIEKYEGTNPDATNHQRSRYLLERAENGLIKFESEVQRQAPVRACAFSPLSNFASGGDDELIHIWDLVEKTPIRYLRGHNAMISCMCYTPDSNYLATCSSSGEVIFWDGRYGHGGALQSIKNAHDLSVICCDFSSQFESSMDKGFLSGNYTFCTGGIDDVVRIWTFKTGFVNKICLKFSLEGHTGAVMCCKFSPDGCLLATAGGDKTVKVWNPITGQKILTATGHDRYITTCIFCGDRIIATGSNDKKIIIWELQEYGPNIVQMENTCQNNSVDARSQGQKSVESWSKNDVMKWLEEIQQESLITIFMENDICGRDLLSLTSENLENSLKIKSLGVRNRILHEIALLKTPLWKQIYHDPTNRSSVEEFQCPITHEVMQNPVVASDGHTYEKNAIQEWIRSGNTTSPMTNAVLNKNLFVPNLALFQLIKKYHT